MIRIAQNIGEATSHLHDLSELMMGYLLKILASLGLDGLKGCGKTYECDNANKKKPDVFISE